MGFTGAPVSQGLISVICVASILAATTSTQHYFDLPLSPHLTRDHQWWRLLTHQIAFANSSELFIAALLLYFTSVPVERSLGSHKYASFLFASFFWSTLLSLLPLIFFSRFGLNRIPAGPFIVVFSILAQSIRLIPTVFYWRLFGIEVTSRIALYVLSAQLIFSQPPISLSLFLLGLLTSSLYLSNFLSLRTFRLSPRVVTLSQRLLTPFVSNAVIGTGNLPSRSTATTLNEVMSLQRRANEQAAGNAGGGMAGFVRGGTFLPSGTTATTNTVPPSRPGVTTARGTTVGAMNTGVGGGVPTPPPPTTTITAGSNTLGTATPIVPPTSTSPAVAARTGPRAFVRQWTQGLTGGTSAAQPTQEQIAHLTAIFPHHRRDLIVSALQTNELDVERAATTLLAS
ncbi:BZ3500_MvSof-1268-A1-R1_Chr5-2g07791 [Microbotryum saponariae]|uniref:BZ3500_MvSof-1268-A1-R1_Chr5-2g07791 protein n=1 Tax=Microbotryum saponariae TaxID=289078 RepID=A0A2X0KM97_9BASI|nr:BZ3500_MvSof-1268-A1-R1_Chr5-2g07791 [Microbotryum saponariae]SDA05660.1 BZ3501_MvSof-1269-A2-R1_Chr5-2g07613 [Microbotryum saponariae]